MTQEADQRPAPVTACGPSCSCAFLQMQLAQARKERADDYQKYSDRVAVLRTDLDRAADRASAAASRADLAEERIARLRDRLEHGEQFGARDLARDWDIERKRRARG